MVEYKPNLMWSLFLRVVFFFRFRHEGKLEKKKTVEACFAGFKALIETWAIFYNQMTNGNGLI